MKRRRISKVDTVHERALQMVAALKSGRDKGKITPDNPIRGARLAEELNKYYGWDPPLSGDAGVRELVNYARSVRQPVTIGDKGYGYYYARTSAEMMITVVDQKSRIAKASKALQGSEECVREMVQVEAELFKRTA